MTSDKVTRDVLKYENSKGEDLGERSLRGLVTRHRSVGLEKSGWRLCRSDLRKGSEGVNNWRLCRLPCEKAQPSRPSRLKKKVNSQVSRLSGLPERRRLSAQQAAEPLQPVASGRTRLYNTVALVTRHSSLVTVIFTAALCTVACRLDMQVQPKYKPLEQSTFFDDGRSERPVVPGTVARGRLRIDEQLYTGKVNGALVDTFPFPVTRQVLERGQQRYNIFCSPCHDEVGTGRGMIVQRGFQQPPSYHIDRLRQAPVGHFFDVITNGWGAMYSYAARVPPQDRWAIVAYIRALQLSQRATVEDVPEPERSRLTEEAK